MGMSNKRGCQETRFLPPLETPNIFLASSPYVDHSPQSFLLRSAIELKGVQEGHQVGSFFVAEDEAQVSLVVVDHVLERRGDAVVEVRRVRGESPERRRLEFAE